MCVYVLEGGGRGGGGGVIALQIESLKGCNRLNDGSILNLVFSKTIQEYTHTRCVYGCCRAKRICNNSTFTDSPELAPTDYFLFPILQTR